MPSLTSSTTSSNTHARLPIVLTKDMMYRIALEILMKTSYLRIDPSWKIILYIQTTRRNTIWKLVFRVTLWYTCTSFVAGNTPLSLPTATIQEYKLFTRSRWAKSFSYFLSFLVYVSHSQFSGESRIHIQNGSHVCVVTSRVCGMLGVHYYIVHSHICRILYSTISYNM